MFLFCCFGFLFVCLFVCFRDRVSLCSSGCPGTHFVDQAGLELRNPPASAFQVLGLKACTTMPGSKGEILRQEKSWRSEKGKGPNPLISKEARIPGVG